MKRENTLEICQLAADRSEKLVMMDYRQEDVSSHDHHFFELAYITGGTAEHTWNDRHTSLRAGDYFIMDYGSCHRYEACRDLTLINCLFLPEAIDETLQGCRSLAALLKGCLIRYYRMTVGEAWEDRIFHDEEGRVGRLLEGMVEEYRDRRLGSTEIFRCRLREILILTLRMLVREQRRYPDSAVVAAAVRYVESAYGQKPTLQAFCGQEHYSLPYMSRRFKAETGMTFREYLQKVRIEKCCELLTGTDLTITEAARKVGYEDMKFFHRVFRRYLQMTPREYRNRWLTHCKAPVGSM